MPRFSVVIPCYRSGSWLEELVRRVDQVLVARGEEYEILLINDASPDETWPAMLAIAEKFPHVRAFDLQFNVGQYRATLCGLERAAGELVITMDDDLQHPPEEIPKLIDALLTRPELDCVMARYDSKKHGPLRNLGSRVMRWMNVKLYGAPRNVVPSSFRIMRRSLAVALTQFGTVRPILSPLIFRATKRIANVDVQHEPRRRGRSGYGIARLTGIVIDNLLSATTLPLRIVSGVGLASATASFAIGAYHLVRYFTHRTQVRGFTTLVLLVSFFGGMTLVAVGLLGEYLSRVIDEVRRPPRYVVRAEVGEKDKEKRG